MIRLLARRRAGWLAALLLLMIMTLPVAAQEEGIVSSVNGEPITRAAFQARVRLVRWQYLKELKTLYDATGGNLQLARDFVLSRVNDLSNPDQLGDAVLEEMERERLLWQTGASLGITPTAEDAQAVEARFFSLWTSVPVEELATSPEAQAFIDGWYTDATAASGLAQNDVRVLFETEALRGRLYNYLAANVPTEELAVRTRHILCSFHPENVTDTTPPTSEQRDAAKTCIQAAQLRLASGELFEVVARDLSHDRTSARDGGNIGWSLISYLTENYANAVRDAELNTVIGPVETEFGLHLIEALERRMQTLTDEEYAASQQGYFQLWTDELWANAAVERRDDWVVGVPTDPALDSLAPEILSAISKLQEG
jgi:hypothetical protein